VAGDVSPLITVIITCYNIKDYVQSAIHSVLVQSYPPIEIIVVDDGSSDGTESALETYVSDGRIIYIRKENGGPSSARNCGIRHATGDLIALLDGDDLWEPEKLESQVAAFNDNGTVGMVFCDFSTFDDHGNVACQKNASLYGHCKPVEFDYLLSRNNFIYPSTVMIHRQIIETIGYFDESLRGPEDYDMWLRISRQFKVIGMVNSLVRIRQHSANLTKGIPLMIKNEVAAIEKHRNSISKLAFRRRMAKVYLINADRSIHAYDRIYAVKLLWQGIVTYPFLCIDVLIVFAKMLIGGSRAEHLRRWLNENSVARSLFEAIYKHY